MRRCECPNAGWCERHKVTKGERMHELCDHADHPPLVLLIAAIYVATNLLVDALYSLADPRIRYQ